MKGTLGQMRKKDSFAPARYPPRYSFILWCTRDEKGEGDGPMRLAKGERDALRLLCATDSERWEKGTVAQTCARPRLSSSKHTRLVTHTTTLTLFGMFLFANFGCLRKARSTPFQGKQLGHQKQQQHLLAFLAEGSDGVRVYIYSYTASSIRLRQPNPGRERQQK
ncbi:hypothetical protein DFS34DRAFT_637960 [Phlyctochytrium arcticum]|nr:hypothetical protein DFS34DRAFT_637960 [Phlyctochytrium arcticum]